MLNGISVCVSALPWVPEPSLAASVLLVVTLPNLPVLCASDLAQIPSPVWNAAPYKLRYLFYRPVRSYDPPKFRITPPS